MNVNEPRWQTVPLEMKHVKEASDVHIAAFPDYFLSFLGRRFIRELYRAFACDETSISIVAEDKRSAKIQGAVIGTIDPKGFFTRLAVKRWWSFGASSLSALAKDPRIAIRVFRGLFYRGNPPNDKKRALLSSIAVLPDQQRTGLGSILLKSWEELARENEMLGCYLTTDAEGNDAVRRFYERNGWRVEAEFVTPEGRRMLRYIIDWE